MFPLRDSVAWTKRPIVTFVLIAACIAAFGYQLSLGGNSLQAFLMEYALVPRRYFNPSWGEATGLSPWDISPFLTNAFMHGGFLHIISNLWTLYIFAPALEERLGSGMFLFLYLASGVAASVAHAVFNPFSPVPALGASGAIAGVIAAYASKFPYAHIRTLILIVIFPLLIDIPAVLFAGFWFLTQILQGTSELFMPSTGGGIAWWAHIGGFLAGWFLMSKLDPGSAVAVPQMRWGRLGPTWAWSPWR